MLFGKKKAGRRIPTGARPARRPLSSGGYASGYLQGTVFMPFDDTLNEHDYSADASICTDEQAQAGDTSTGSYDSGSSSCDSGPYDGGSSPSYDSGSSYGSYDSGSSSSYDSGSSSSYDSGSSSSYDSGSSSYDSGSSSYDSGSY